MSCLLEKTKTKFFLYRQNGYHGPTSKAPGSDLFSVPAAPIPGTPHPVFSSSSSTWFAN
jgi:hypothetical protein